MKLRNHADFNGYETRNRKDHVLGADPSLGGTDGGRTWWNSATGRFRGWDGAAAVTLTNLIESVSPTGALRSTVTGKDVGLSIVPASQSEPGTMSDVDKTKLDNATGSNTPSRLVMRDSSGNFAAGTISAALNGLAADSTLLGGQTLAQVRDFNQTTGQRTALSAISDFDTAVRLSRLDQMTAPTALVSLNNQRFTNSADPVNPQDLATKNYVDAIATGLDPKGSVRIATIGALPAVTYANGSAGVGATLTATGNGVMAAIDGITPAVGNRILVKNQASAVQNGIYSVTSVGAAGAPFVLTRATDADSAAEVTPGLFTFVEEGTSLARTGWVLNSTGVTTMGTTNLAFQQFSGAGTYTAGNGLSLTGSVFSAVTADSNKIVVTGAGINISSTYVGQPSITTLGTVTTGVWQGTDIAVADGGTGAGTAVAARTNLAAATAKATDIPAGTSYTWNHGLGTLDLIIQVIEKASGDVVLVDPTVVDTNNVRVVFGDPVAANAYRLIVVGLGTT